MRSETCLILCLKCWRRLSVESGLEKCCVLQWNCSKISLLYPTLVTEPGIVHRGGTLRVKTCFILGRKRRCRSDLRSELKNPCTLRWNCSRIFPLCHIGNFLPETGLIPFVRERNSQRTSVGFERWCRGLVICSIFVVLLHVRWLCTVKYVVSWTSPGSRTRGSARMDLCHSTSDRSKSHRKSHRRGSR